MRRPQSCMSLSFVLFGLTLTYLQCTVDQCVEEGGKASCSFTPKDCGSDQCGAKTCNATNNGACETAVLNCDDGNDCTDDVFHCNGTHALCLYNQTTACDDSILFS